MADLQVEIQATVERLAGQQIATRVELREKIESLERTVNALTQSITVLLITLTGKMTEELDTAAPAADDIATMPLALHPAPAVAGWAPGEQNGIG